MSKPQPDVSADDFLRPQKAMIIIVAWGLFFRFEHGSPWAIFRKG